MEGRKKCEVCGVLFFEVRLRGSNICPWCAADMLDDSEMRNEVEERPRKKLAGAHATR